jgi:hypothetical protein
VPPEIDAAELERRLFTPAGFYKAPTPLMSDRPAGLNLGPVGLMLPVPPSSARNLCPGIDVATG